MAICGNKSNRNEHFKIVLHIERNLTSATNQPYLCSPQTGDIELSTNLSTYMQTVICEQYTEAFAIDLRNYDRLVTRRHAVTGRFIAQNALLKLDNRAHRFTHIPLLQILVERFARLLTDYNRIKRQREKYESPKLHMLQFITFNIY